MSGTRQRIAALTAAQRELLEAGLAELRGGPRPGGIQPRSRTRPAPLGVAQRREWAISRWRPSNNVPAAFRVDGPIDLRRLNASVETLLARHEVLRTLVEIDAEGTPVQVVADVPDVLVPVIDLADCPDHQQDERVRELCRAETLKPFDPTDAQRLRVSLIQLAAQVHICLLVADHTSADAWSLGILIQELGENYARLGGAALPPVSAPAIQFADYAVWQRERYGPDHVAAEVAHWREVLDGIPEHPRLPADRERPERPTYAGDICTVATPEPLVRELYDFCDEQQTSLFPVLLAAASVLLCRQVDETDLVIGSLVSGRMRRETEDMVGCFANPLPLRVQLERELTLRQVVDRARHTLATALDHQDVPFDQVAGELGLDPGSVQNSFGRVWINVLTVPTRSFELPGMSFSNAPLDLGLASVDLTLSVTPEPGRLELQWQYMTEVFDRETIILLAGQFQTVLRHLISDPDLTIDDVDIDGGVAGETPPAGR